MQMIYLHRCLQAGSIILALTAAGCNGETPGKSNNPTRTTRAKPSPTREILPPTTTQPAPEVRGKEIAKNIYFDIQGDKRRVIVRGEVCLRDGQLEGLLTCKGAKRYEYLLDTKADARLIHGALIATGAIAGSPVEFQPKFKAPTGSTIHVYIQYLKDGKPVTVRAQDWIRDSRTMKNLEFEWVFAGSRLFQDPDNMDSPPFYLANSGDVITVVNTDTAMLDLPIKNLDTDPSLGMRTYVAHTERIPPENTGVNIIFEAVIDKKESDKTPESKSTDK